MSDDEETPMWKRLEVQVVTHSTAIQPLPNAYIVAPFFKHIQHAEDDSVSLLGEIVMIDVLNLCFPVL